MKLLYHRTSRFTTVLARQPGRVSVSN